MAPKLKRAYAAPAGSDGMRLLVDRLWPRGLSKRNAKIDLWLREIAPSTGLRRWFGHDPARWDEFRKRYARELDKKPDLVRQLAGLARRRRVTLLFAARDEERNNAVALRQLLTRRPRVR